MRLRTIIFFYVRPSTKWCLSLPTWRLVRREAYSRRLSSAIASITAEKLQSRFSIFLIATALRCTKETCAGSTAIGWTCSARPSLCPAAHLEEHRPRWGVRTSNPSGAASLSQVGSTPTLLRQNLRVLENGACAHVTSRQSVKNHFQTIRMTGSPDDTDPMILAHG